MGGHSQCVFGFLRPEERIEKESSRVSGQFVSAGASAGGWCPDRSDLDSFEALMVGWVIARQRTVTCMIEVAGLVGQRQHSVFHRVFASARWSLDRLGLAVFEVLYLCCGETVFLAVDDTLAPKRGLKMFSAGMHYDPILCSRGVKVTPWPHSWVVLGVIVRFQLCPERPFCLSVLFELFLNKACGR